MNYKEELVYISKYVGMRKDYVQAGGGNTSVKISNELMFIKSSGIALSDMNEENGYSLVNYKLIKNCLMEYNNSKKYDKKILEKSLIEGKRPSIETFLHSITEKYTIHVHSTIINILTCQESGMDILKKLFPNSILVDYALPGIELANKLIEQSYNQSKKEIIFLKNHGIIVSDDNYIEAIYKLNEIVNKVANYLNIDISKYNNVSYIYNLYREIQSDFSNVIYLSEDRYIMNALEKNNGYIWNYLLFPDSVVYCGIEHIEAISNNKEDFIKLINRNPKIAIILLDGYIYINAKSIKHAKDIEDILSSSAQIYLNAKEKLEYIDNIEQEKINKSDSEKYRKNM